MQAQVDCGAGLLVIPAAGMPTAAERRPRRAIVSDSRPWTDVLLDFFLIFHE
jgi:hypothetical protein